jgi:hypothetical protein
MKTIAFLAARLRETREYTHRVTRFGDSSVWAPRDPVAYRRALALA